MKRRRKRHGEEEYPHQDQRNERRQSVQETKSCGTAIKTYVRTNTKVGDYFTDGNQMPIGNFGHPVFVNHRMSRIAIPDSDK